MSSPAASDDERPPAKLKTTPNQRRVSTGRNGGTTPRKTSANNTPIRKVSATKVRTPNSAPAPVRKASKKAEPTLFSDFLLGRPSPQRARTGSRRKSLDAVKKDLRLAEHLGQHAPGGVSDRVKQWQKGDLFAEIAARKAAEKKPETDSEWEDDKPNSKGGDTKPRPGRRKSKEPDDDDDIPVGVDAKEVQKEKYRSKEAGAPKKRVISDDHWMKKAEKKETPPRKGMPIPKNFLAMTNNPPLDKKIKDWAKRNASEEPEVVPEVKISDETDSGEHKESPRKVSKQVACEEHKETPVKRKVSRQKIPEQSPRQGAPIPKNFLQTTFAPPLEKKIGDWAKRNATVEPVTPKGRKASKQETPEDTPKRRQVSRQESPEDTIVDEEVTPRRRKPGREEKSDDTPRSRRASRQQPQDDVTRIKPSPDPVDDGMKPSRDYSFKAGDDGTRARKDSAKRTPKREDAVEPRTPRKASEKHLRPPDLESRCDSTSLGDETQDDETTSWTPSRTESKRRPRKSDTPTESLEEIPFGNSAFSVLDLPVGAEANTLKNTLRRPPPKRNNSFAMPKVLKKVYNEAINIVHDTVDPPRAGVNHPPSIESWLKGTTDPFVDRPPTAESSLEVPATSPSRRRSYKEDDRDEQELMVEAEARSKRRERARSTYELDGRDRARDDGSPKARETLPSMESSPPLSPTGLKRSPATRNAPSPKSARKLPLKDALLEAFKGESTYRTKNNPLTEVTGMHENQSPPESKSIERDVVKERSSKQSPQISDDRSGAVNKETQNSPLPKRPPPTTGAHRLSTIASVETFITPSSATETASELSQTTVTGTTLTGQTQSSLSTAPTQSSLSRKSKSGLKRRLTKHSDLLSVLSLPDSGEPGREKSIRSARSIRTSRVSLDNATIRDLMRELADDEEKYLRELNTLVDGVIPVLLTSVVQKSDSAVAAGLFDHVSTGESLDRAFTKPIVDMGIALERLRSLHKRIPHGDPEALSSWAHSAHAIYAQYLGSWRAGFTGLVINLSPATESASVSPVQEIAGKGKKEEVMDDGERVDVSHLLKRPIVRIKYLTKVVEGIDRLKPTDLSKRVRDMWIDLEGKGKKRVRQEIARLVDRDASYTDATRARDPRTMALVEDAKIDKTRQVCAKDDFNLDMEHSSGQRVQCQVEAILRDKPSDPNDEGDLLVRAVEPSGRKWLLFSPIVKKQVSARIGNTGNRVIILIRGVTNGENWEECVALNAEDPVAANEWVEMLGSNPMPPPEVSRPDDLESIVSTAVGDPKDVEIPIGERRRLETEDVSDGLKCSPHASKHDFVFDKPVTQQARENEAAKPIRHARARYHSRTKSLPASDTLMSGALPTPEPEIQHVKTSETPKSSSPLNESMRPVNLLKKQPPATPAEEDRPPPPPAHKVLTTPNTLKKLAPILETPTPKSKNKRTSSPLKHEYQPSNASESSPEDEDSEEDDTFSESSDEEELAAAELAEPTYPYSKRISPSASIYSLPNTTLAPSNSASQAPYRGVPVQRSAPNAVKLTAAISQWTGMRWDDMHPGQCSIVVSPGLIEAFELTAAHAQSDPGAVPGEPDDYGRVNPLVGLPLTPVVLLRKSTAVDIEVNSPPIPESRLRCTGRVRFRALTAPACSQLYNAINIARTENPVYKKLEEEARINSFGTNAYEKAVASSRRRSSFGFLGRKKSYRASSEMRAVEVEPSEQASQSSSTFSRLRRLSGSGMFNLKKSSIEKGPGGNISSVPSSSYGSRYSGTSDPTPPLSPSLASASSPGAGTNMTKYGNENLKIRLYKVASISSWEDRGDARLSITAPPPGMRPASSLYNGVEKRIIVKIKAPKGLSLFSSSSGGTNREKEVEEENLFNVTVLDVVLGSGNFGRMGRTGVVCDIWEDVRGDDGRVGVVGRFGPSGGVKRKWLFQCKGLADAGWVFGLTQRGF